MTYICRRHHIILTYMDITIRPEAMADRQAVNALVKAAFDTVSESDHEEHRLVERLRASEGFVPGLSLVAVADGGRIVGHILLTEVEVVTGTSAATSLAVAPLSVLPGYQGRGIGGTLLRKAHATAAALGYKSALLLGHKDYYPKFGYRKASDFGIAFPFDAPDDCCMAIELSPGGLAGVSGTVNYPPPFFG